MALVKDQLGSMLTPCPVTGQEEWDVQVGQTEVQAQPCVQRWGSPCRNHTVKSGTGVFHVVTAPQGAGVGWVAVALPPGFHGRVKAGEALSAQTRTTRGGTAGVASSGSVAVGGDCVPRMGGTGLPVAF